MTAPATRLNDALRRLLPFLLLVAIAACGFIWVVQPRLGAYLRARSDVAALRARVKTLQASAERARPLPHSDMAASQREFERRVSDEDKVAEVAAALAKAVLDSAPGGQLRGFTIETGEGVTQAAGAGAGGADARFALFPYAVSYTPVRISFESTFEAAGDFLWKVRDLPTTVDIRSARMTRGLPLMKVDVLVYVIQRGGAEDTGRVVAPGDAASGAGGPTVPRAVDPAGAGG